jgi:hypothetical protein
VLKETTCKMIPIILAAKHDSYSYAKDVFLRNSMSLGNGWRTKFHNKITQI